MHRTGCRRSDHPQIGRRELLHVGGLSLVGAGLSHLLRLERDAVAAPRAAVAKSVVFIFQSGGPSQHETFDPKPLAPDTVRGEYGVTQTKLPGFQFCEYLPKLAARADRFSIVRTMHHIADRQFRNEHSSCAYLLHTGTTELPVGDTNASISAARVGRMQWPSIGSMIAYAAPVEPSVGLPGVIEIPRGYLMNYSGREPGLLGPKYDRWGVDLAPKCNAKDAAGSCPNCFSHDDPNEPGREAGPGPNAWWDNTSCRNADFHLPNLGVADAISVPQLDHRTELLGRLEQMRRSLDAPEHRATIGVAYDAHREQALRLVLSAAQRGAHNPFDLTQESDATRDQYGREEWGQGFLVARRLVESGVRMVQSGIL